jgi:hypothetical protein
MEFLDNLQVHTSALADLDDSPLPGPAVARHCGVLGAIGALPF